eukprot:5157776-Prorocentrum_lima.AAC.1
MMTSIGMFFEVQDAMVLLAPRGGIGLCAAYLLCFRVEPERHHTAFWHTWPLACSSLHHFVLLALAGFAHCCDSVMMDRS